MVAAPSPCLGARLSSVILNVLSRLASERLGTDRSSGYSEFRESVGVSRQHEKKSMRIRIESI